jgi:hypothetical protein
LRRHDPRAVESGADDERRRAPARPVEHYVTHDADTGAPRADDEPLGVRQPVLEDVAPPGEDVLPHMGPFRGRAGRQTSCGLQRDRRVMVTEDAFPLHLSRRLTHV